MNAPEFPKGFSPKAPRACPVTGRVLNFAGQARAWDVAATVGVVVFGDGAVVADLVFAAGYT